MPPTWSVRLLRSVEDAHIEQLADVLMDCVEGGASVADRRAPSRASARSRSGAPLRRASRLAGAAVLVAEDSQGVCGTVQLIFDLPDNQPHRADLAKMLVHRRARRQGLGEALMRAAESAARESGKSLLVLDAVTHGDAARLYGRLGWVRVGDIPRYALMPGGEPCGTTYYYRDLRE